MSESSNTAPWLMLCYGSGLRISEAVSLKAGHIDSARMLIRVEKGKGAKDRYTVLSQTLLNLLRQYWKAQRPKDYLFPGSQPGTHVQPGTIQEICRDACRMAGLEKRVTPHILRLSRYETRFDRQFSRALQGFNELRANPTAQARFEQSKALTDPASEKT